MKIKPWMKKKFIPYALLSILSSKRLHLIFGYTCFLIISSSMWHGQAYIEISVRKANNKKWRKKVAFVWRELNWMEFRCGKQTECEKTRVGFNETYSLGQVVKRDPDNSMVIRRNKRRSLMGCDFLRVTKRESATRRVRRWKTKHRRTSTIEPHAVPFRF